MPRTARKIKVSVLILFMVLCLGAGYARAWEGALKDGTVITETDLRRILKDHQTWLDTRTKEGKRADLAGATLVQAPLAAANLVGANLKEAELYMADLSASMLEYADLTGARLFGANLRGAMLGDANLTGALLGDSDLRGAMLWKANLKEADLEGADLRRASLFGADVSGVDFYRAALGAVVWEPKAETFPIISRMASAVGLKYMLFKESPAGLMELRQAFREDGFRFKERQVTYALRHGLLLRMSQPERGLMYWLFEWPCAWGLEYAGPILIIFALIPFFAVLYVMAIYITGGRALWRQWSRGPEHPELDKPILEPVTPQETTAELSALYFSLLCALRIGWGDFSIAGWVRLLAPRDYRFKAVGFARTIAGLQTLVSIYLAALALFCFFGRPFG